MVNYEKNRDLSYQLVMDHAIESNDTSAIEILSSIGPPPWSDPRSFGKMRRIIRKYENLIVSDFPEMKLGEGYRSKSTRKAYFAGEELSFIQFIGMSGHGMSANINLNMCCTKFALPIYLIQGADDLLTSAQITEEYFKKIKAPLKEYIYLENTGHDTNITMLNSQFQALKSGVEKFLGNIEDHK